VPTQEQLESRKKLDDFVEAASSTLRKIKGGLKSKWFSRPDDELKGWIERGRAIDEIKDSMGYQLIVTQADREIVWAQQQLEICAESDVRDLRLYLRALRFLHDFILTTERNADIASGVLSGREAAIGRDATTFVKNAQVRN
jgi:hypothetical protein